LAQDITVPSLGALMFGAGMKNLISEGSEEAEQRIATEGAKLKAMVDLNRFAQA